MGVPPYSVVNSWLIQLHLCSLHLAVPTRCQKLKVYCDVYSATLLLPECYNFGTQGFFSSGRLCICWNHPAFTLLDVTLTPGLWPCVHRETTPGSRPTSPYSPSCCSNAYHHQAGQSSLFTPQAFGDILLLLVAFQMGDTSLHPPGKLSNPGLYPFTVTPTASACPAPHEFNQARLLTPVASLNKRSRQAQALSLHTEPHLTFNC